MNLKAIPLTTYLLSAGIPALAPLQLLAGDAPKLSDPGMEKGTETWEINKYDKGISRFVAEAARTGKMGLEVDDQDAQAGSEVFSEHVSAPPGTAWKATFWAKITEGDGIGVYLSFFDGAGQPVPFPDAKDIPHVSISSAKSEWKEYEVTAVVPEGCDSIAVRVHSYKDSVVKAYLDDFVLAPSK